MFVNGERSVSPGLGQKAETAGSPAILGTSPEDRRFCVPAFRRVCPCQQSGLRPRFGRPSCPNRPCVCHRFFGSAVRSFLRTGFCSAGELSSPDRRRQAGIMSPFADAQRLRFAYVSFARIRCRICNRVEARCRSRGLQTCRLADGELFAVEVREAHRRGTENVTSAWCGMREPHRRAQAHRCPRERVPGRGGQCLGATVVGSTCATKARNSRPELG